MDRRERAGAGFHPAPCLRITPMLASPAATAAPPTSPGVGALSVRWRYALAGAGILALAAVLIALSVSVGGWDGVAVIAVIAGILLARLARGWWTLR